MHLTNYSLNKDSPTYKVPDPNDNMLVNIIQILKYSKLNKQEPNLASKRTLTSVWKNLEKEGYNKVFYKFQ